jgi:hypothetical protein
VDTISQQDFRKNREDEEGIIINAWSLGHYARLKQWKTLTINKAVAKEQEAKIKADFMMGKMVNERVKGPMTFKTFTNVYFADPKIQRQPIF